MKYLFLCTLIVFFSCKQNDKKKQDPVIEQQEVSSEETHENVDGVVTLNNGKLWLANHETTEGIDKMKKRMSSFSEKENMEAYALLKEDLEADFTELFQKCTMKGEAHNQLHNYLFPFIDLFDGLESSELSTCKKSFNKLKAHIDEYSSYFK